MNINLKNHQTSCGILVATFLYAGQLFQEEKNIIHEPGNDEFSVHKSSVNPSSNCHDFGYQNAKTVVRCEGNFRRGI